MKKTTRYPYEIVSIFLISFSFKRSENIPPNIPVPVKTKFKLLKSEFPKIQINLLIETPDDLPISFKIESVGLFNYIGEKLEYDPILDTEFVIEKGFHVIWPYISQMVKLFTSQMGMNPLNIEVPSIFEKTVIKSKK